MKRLHRPLLYFLLSLFPAFLFLPPVAAQVLVGGAAYQARENILAAESRFTLIGDSLTNMPAQTNRMAHAILKDWEFGGDITALLEPRVGATGFDAAGLFNHANYEANDTYGSGNLANTVIGNNTYGNFARATVASFTGATFTFSTKTLTKTGAFTKYVHAAGRYIYITGGTGVTVGWYEIASRVSDDAVTLVSAITAGGDPTNVTATGPVTDGFFGVPLESYNWYWDGTLSAFATGSVPPSGALGCLGRTLTRTTDPIAGENTFQIFGNPPMVFRHLYYGAANLRSGDNQRFYNGIGPSTLGDFDLTVDARPLWYEGDDPENDASPRSGGYVRGGINALWPDTRATTAIGGATTTYWADVEALGASGAIAADGSTNIFGTMGFKCAASSDPDWVGGVQFEVVGASSWTIGGFALNSPSDSVLQKQMDHLDWLTFRDVTTIDRSLPGTFVVIVDPEAITAAQAQTRAEALVDKVTAADHMIGNPTPTILFVIWPKTSARSVAEMEAWRDGIIAACATRTNAGFVNLFDYYAQAVPAHIDSDGTHPDDEAAADALAADIWTLLSAASPVTRYPVEELAAAVWDRLAADVATTDSIGLQLKTNLDATVSSRSTFDDTTDLVTANVTQVSGDATAADNLEAVLDGTGANVKFNTLTGTKVVITNTAPGDSAVKLSASGDGSVGLLLEANGTSGIGMSINDTSDIGIGGGSSDLTGLGSAAATAILSSPSNKLLTNASGQVELPTTDGVTAAKLREVLLSYLAGKTTLTDNGGTKTLRFYKQDGTTPLVDITYNANGEWTDTEIDPTP